MARSYLCVINCFEKREREKRGRSERTGEEERERKESRKEIDLEL